MTEDQATVAAAQSDNGHADPVDIKALIASSRRAERTVPVCLRGDLQAEFEDLERALAELNAARAPADTRLSGHRPGRDIAEAIEALREAMRSATVVFRLRALSPRAWDDLVAAHPPRKTEDGGVDPRDYSGVNVDTFFPPLVRACVIYPGLDDQDWETLLGDGEHGLSNRQFDELAGAAWTVNKGSVDVPFSRAASRLIQGSEPE